MLARLPRGRTLLGRGVLWGVPYPMACHSPLLTHSSGGCPGFAPGSLLISPRTTRPRLEPHPRVDAIRLGCSLARRTDAAARVRWLHALSSQRHTTGGRHGFLQRFVQLHGRPGRPRRPGGHRNARSRKQAGHAHRACGLRRARRSAGGSVGPCRATGRYELDCGGTGACPGRLPDRPWNREDLAYARQEPPGRRCQEPDRQAHPLRLLARGRPDHVQQEQGQRALERLCGLGHP